MEQEVDVFFLIDLIQKYFNTEMQNSTITHIHARVWGRQLFPNGNLIGSYDIFGIISGLYERDLTKLEERGLLPSPDKDRLATIYLPKNHYSDFPQKPLDYMIKY